MPENSPHVLVCQGLLPYQFHMFISSSSPASGPLTGSQGLQSSFLSCLWTLSPSPLVLCGLPPLLFPLHSSSSEDLSDAKSKVLLSSVSLVSTFTSAIWTCDALLMNQQITFNQGANRNNTIFYSFGAFLGHLIPWMPFWVLTVCWYADKINQRFHFKDKIKLRLTWKIPSIYEVRVIKG